MATLPFTAVICVNALVYGMLVQAVVQQSHFDKAGVDDLLFNDNVLFDNDKTVRSLLDCARRCAGDEDCRTFTYLKHASEARSCRGHSAGMTSDDAHEDVIGARTYSMPVQESGLDLPDFCLEENYMVMEDERRDVLNTVNAYLCDKTALTPGWYRFYFRGSDAVMPTACPSTYRCGTDAPMWLDLQGAALPEVGQERNARACASWSGSCCYQDWDTPVTVRNCGLFHVYNLTKTNHCKLAYCAELKH